nr:hypothetical protein DA06_04065 [Georgenia sp. SUBG003]
MNRLTWAALAAATVVAAIALTDAVTHGLTGSYSAFTESGTGWAYYSSTAAHGLIYALLAAVLAAHAEHIDTGRRAVRRVRRALIGVLAVQAVAFLLGVAVSADDLPTWVSGMTGVAFLLNFPVSALLGILLLRTPGRRLPALLLTAVLGGLALTVVLGALGSDFAHPAYAEVPQFFGVALLGRAAHRHRSPAPASQVAASPTSATAS